MAVSGWPDRRAAHALALAVALTLLLAWRYERVFAAFATPHADRWAASLFVLLALPACVVFLFYGVRRSRGGQSRQKVRGRSLFQLAWRRFTANQLAVAAVYVIVFFYLVALLAPLIAGYDPSAIGDVMTTRYQPPSLQHPFGTDDFGRDLFSRAVYGARVSLSIGLLAMVVAVSVGTLYGAIAGYFGDAIDNAMMRLVDVIIAFPTFFLLLMLVGIFEANIFFLVLILGLTSWTGTARFVRGEILSLKQREFIEGARAIGLPAHLVIARHLIPNALAPVLVSAALMVGGMIGAEAGLSFLGIGIRPPTPSWGNMISAGQDALLVAWWIAFFPGCLLALTIISFSLLSDGLRDALDPKTLMRKYV